MGGLTATRQTAPPARPRTTEDHVGSRFDLRVTWVPALCSFAVFALLAAGGALSTSAPASSDLTGHLLPQVILREDLLATGRIRGWSPDWFAGFPAYYFYFPLPGVAAALLSLVVTPEVALRVVTLAGLVLFPWILHLFARWIALERSTSGWVIAVGTSFLLTQSFTVLGGNVTSTLAGEFSYSWSLGFLLLYLGVLGRKSPRRPDGVLAGAILAAAILSHVLPPIAVVGGLAPFALFGGRRRSVLESWLVACGLSAFWTVPMVLRLGQTGSVDWSYPLGRTDLLPAELYLLLPAAFFGLWAGRRSSGLWMLVASAWVGILVAVLPQGLFMPGRLLPFWFLAVHVLAGIGIAAALAAAKRRRVWLAAALFAGIGPWAGIMVLRGVDELVTFERRILGGLAEAPAADARRELVEELRHLPPGRVYWEEHERLADLGGLYALSLLPYWTDHAVLQGLWAESAPLSRSLATLRHTMSSEPAELPFRAPTAGSTFDPERGLDQLRMLGVRYVVALSPELAGRMRAAPGLVPVASVDGMELYDLGETPLVVVLPCVAPVGRAELRARAASWFAAADDDAPWPVADGSASRGVSCGGGAGAPRAPRDLVVEAERISFRAASPGVPHLVRVSSFPNWRASGAEGPFTAAPWFMMVIPTDAEVVLEFRPTWVERVGWTLTGACVLVLLALSRRRGRGSQP